MADPDVSGFCDSCMFFEETEYRLEGLDGVVVPRNLCRRYPSPVVIQEPDAHWCGEWEE